MSASSPTASLVVCVQYESRTALGAVPGFNTVIEGPILPNDGRPVVVDAQLSRQNRLHQILRLISGEIDSSSCSISCLLISLLSEAQGRGHAESTAHQRMRLVWSVEVMHVESTHDR
jgi:hypothetical protein